jgi:hypothetical protein
MVDPKIPAAPAMGGLGAAVAPVFEVTSVEKSGAPDGGSDQDWYRYVLTSRRSTITGHRRGSAKGVHAYASQCADQLNTRAAQAQSIWSPRGRKPGAAK